MLNLYLGAIDSYGIERRCSDDTPSKNAYYPNNVSQRFVRTFPLATTMEEKNPQTNLLPCRVLDAFGSSIYC